MRKLALLAAAILFAGCSNPAEAKYQTTWTKPAYSTTCYDFGHVMDDHQRWVASFERLLVLRTPSEQTVIPEAEYPPDDQVTKFTDLVAASCGGQINRVMSDVAGDIYRSKPTEFCRMVDRQCLDGS